MASICLKITPSRAVWQNRVGVHNARAGVYTWGDYTYGRPSRFPNCTARATFSFCQFQFKIAVFQLVKPQKWRRLIFPFSFAVLVPLIVPRACFPYLPGTSGPSIPAPFFNLHSFLSKLIRSRRGPKIVGRALLCAGFSWEEGFRSAC